jgi:hypothetical protein
MHYRLARRGDSSSILSRTQNRSASIFNSNRLETLRF